MRRVVVCIMADTNPRLVGRFSHLKGVREGSSWLNAAYDSVIGDLEQLDVATGTAIFSAPYWTPDSPALRRVLSPLRAAARPFLLGSVVALRLASGAAALADLRPSEFLLPFIAVARFARGRPAQWVRLPRCKRAPEPPPGSTPGRHLRIAALRRS